MIDRIDRRAAFAGFLLLLAACAGAHFHVVAHRPDYSGVLLVGSHLFTLAVTTLLLALCAALGIRLLRWARVELEGPFELIPFGTALGMATVGTVFLAAGTVGALRPVAVFAVLGGLTLVAWPSWQELLKQVRKSPSELGTLVPEAGLRRWGLTVTTAAAALLLLPALAPPFDWDSLAYHLAVAAEYLETGWVHLPEDNFHATLLGPVQMLYLPLLAVKSHAGPAVMSAILALMLAFTVASVASRLLSSRVGGLCLVAVWSNAVLVAAAVTPRIDTTLVLFTLLGHYALLLAWSRRSRRLFLLGAVILGAAVAVKLQAVAYVLAVLPLAGWLVVKGPWRSVKPYPDRDGRLAEGARTAAAFAALGVCAALPWLIRNQIFVGSPFYVFRDQALQPWLARVAGASEIPAAVDPYALEWLRSVRQPFNLFDAFFAPWRLSPEGVQYFLSPLLLLVPLAVIGVRRNRAAWWLLAGGLGYAAALLIPFPSTNLRYLTPAVVPLTMVTVYGILSLFETPFGTSRASWITGTLATIALLPTALVAAVFILTPSVFGHAIGATSDRSYLDHPLRLYGLREVMEEPRAHSRVLMIFEARAFDIDGDVLQDVSGTNWPYLLGTGTLDRCLEGTGITHVLVNNILPYNHTSRGFDPVRMGMPAFERFADRCLEEVARREPLVLYRAIGHGPEPKSGGRVDTEEG